MRTPLFAILAVTLLLSACNAGGATSISVEIDNPLTASRYGDELADRLANLIIQNDPIIEKPGMKDTIARKISEAKNIATSARALQDRGMMGALIPEKQNMVGYALYVNDTLYFSSDFETDPGPSLHVFLSKVVDPRDATFPDESAIDLGEIQTPYGPATYDVPDQDKPELLRTLVLYDTTLERLYGFAQLSVHGK
jgi:hypothetical protein